MSFRDCESVSSNLKHHRLFFDGDVEIASGDNNKIFEYIIKNGSLPDNVFVDEITEEIKQYNRYSDQKLSTKKDIRDIVAEWTVPSAFMEMDIEQYIKSIQIPVDHKTERLARRDKELLLFKKHNLYDVLKLIVFVVETFKEKNIVWGTGRGSSCSSYIFYLLGLHSVDVIYYDIPITDFFKE